MAAKLKTYQEAVLEAYQGQTAIRRDIYERLLLDTLGWSKTNWLLQGADPMPQALYDQYQEAVCRLQSGEPLQYIVGFEDFYGRTFQVTPATLIPRSETELLVEEALKWAHQQAEPDLKILDLGTGTGAIGLTLALELPFAQVTLSDISQPALAIALKNAKSLGLRDALASGRLQLVESDVLDQIEGQFDLIISNPPYIDHSEEALMDASVLAFEPHSALFAGRGGLAIYEKIASQAPYQLSKTGAIFLEIGFQQGIAVASLFKKAFPEKSVQVLKDYADLDRMVLVTDDTAKEAK